MNRIPLQALADLASDSDDRGELRSALREPSAQPSAGGCCHALFAPLHYEANYAYPLIIWLHPAGKDERQLRRVMPQISVRNYVAVAPRATLCIDAEGDDAATGFCWPQTYDHLYLAERRVFECLEIAREKYHVHPKRVFLAGAGCGGTMALRVALAHPQRFAGVLSIGGGLPRSLAPLARVNDIRGLPLMLMSGQESEHYTQANVSDDLRLLHSAGIDVTLRMYPFGDEMAPLMLADVDRWLMNVVCPTTVSA
jgi:phospholipase/carboxylesterase